MEERKLEWESRHDQSRGSHFRRPLGEAKITNAWQFLIEADPTLVEEIKKLSAPQRQKFINSLNRDDRLNQQALNLFEKARKLYNIKGEEKKQAEKAQWSRAFEGFRDSVVKRYNGAGEFGTIKKSRTDVFQTPLFGHRKEPKPKEKKHRERTPRVTEEEEIVPSSQDIEEEEETTTSPLEQMRVQIRERLNRRRAAETQSGRQNAEGKMVEKKRQTSTMPIPIEEKKEKKKKKGKTKRKIEIQGGEFPKRSSEEIEEGTPASIQKDPLITTDQLDFKHGDPDAKIPAEQVATTGVTNQAGPPTTDAVLQIGGSATEDPFEWRDDSNLGTEVSGTSNTVNVQPPPLPRPVLDSLQQDLRGQMISTTQGVPSTTNSRQTVNSLAVAQVPTTTIDYKGASDRLVVGQVISTQTQQQATDDATIMISQNRPQSSGQAALNPSSSNQMLAPMTARPLPSLLRPPVTVPQAAPVDTSLQRMRAARNQYEVARELFNKAKGFAEAGDAHRAMFLINLSTNMAYLGNQNGYDVNWAESKDDLLKIRNSKIDLDVKDNAVITMTGRISELLQDQKWDAKANLRTEMEMKSGVVNRIVAMTGQLGQKITETDQGKLSTGFDTFVMNPLNKIFGKKSLISKTIRFIKGGLSTFSVPSAGATLAHFASGNYGAAALSALKILDFKIVPKLIEDWRNNAISAVEHAALEDILKSGEQLESPTIHNIQKGLDFITAAGEYYGKASAEIRALQEDKRFLESGIKALEATDPSMRDDPQTSFPESLTGTFVPRQGLDMKDGAVRTGVQQQITGMEVEDEEREIAARARALIASEENKLAEEKENIDIATQTHQLVRSGLKEQPVGRSIPRMTSIFGIARGPPGHLTRGTVWQNKNALFMGARGALEKIMQRGRENISRGLNPTTQEHKTIREYLEAAKEPERNVREILKSLSEKKETKETKETKEPVDGSLSLTPPEPEEEQEQKPLTIMGAGGGGRRPPRGPTEEEWPSETGPDVPEEKVENIIQQYRASRPWRRPYPPPPPPRLPPQGPKSQTSVAPPPPPPPPPRRERSRSPLREQGMRPRQRPGGVRSPSPVGTRPQPTRTSVQNERKQRIREMEEEENQQETKIREPPEEPPQGTEEQERPRTTEATELYRTYQQSTIGTFPQLRLEAMQGGGDEVMEKNMGPGVQEINTLQWLAFNDNAWEANQQKDNTLNNREIIERQLINHDTFFEDNHSLMKLQAGEMLVKKKRIWQLAQLTPGFKAANAPVFQTQIATQGSSYTDADHSFGWKLPNEVDGEFHDVYVREWSSYPKTHPWIQFTEAEGTSTSDAEAILGRAYIDQYSDPFCLLNRWNINTVC